MNTSITNVYPRISHKRSYAMHFIQSAENEQELKNKNKYNEITHGAITRELVSR